MQRPCIAGVLAKTASANANGTYSRIRHGFESPCVVALEPRAIPKRVAQGCPHFRHLWRQRLCHLREEMRRD